MANLYCSGYGVATESLTHEATTYGYGPQDEVTEIISDWGTIQYKHSSKNLRIKKDAPSNSVTGDRWYVFSGLTLIGEMNQSGAVVAYTHGTDGLLAMRDINSITSSFYHYGASGETRYLTDDTGNITDTYYYEAYGAQLASTGSNYNPYQYGGKYGYYRDEASEVLLATWRWYSPSQYRWLSRDPIKFDGGSNVYQYVVGNPVMFVDPDGLEVYNPNDYPIWVKPEDEKDWTTVPPNSRAPISPDGWYDPRTCKTWKVRGKSWLEPLFGTTDVDTDMKKPKCLNGFCIIAGDPYEINPDEHNWSVPDKEPKTHPNSSPLSIK